MRALGIVLARGGSQRLRLKNLRTVNGESLVARAVRCGIQAGLPVVLSSDSGRIAREGRRAGGRHCSLVFRLPDLSGPDVSSEAAAIDAIETLGGEWDAAVLLQPTSPLRTVKTVRRCLADFERLGRPVYTSDLESIAPNGSVYVVSPETLRTQGWAPEGAWVIPTLPQYSVDVDTREDLDRARRFAYQAVERCE